MVDFIFKFLQRIYQFFLIPDSRVISQHDRLLCCLLYKFSQNQPPHPCCIPSIKWMQACVSTIYNTAAIVLQPFFCNFVRIGICHKSRMFFWTLCPGEKPDSCRIQAKTGIAPRGGERHGWGSTSPDNTFVKPIGLLKNPPTISFLRVGGFASLTC